MLTRIPVLFLLVLGGAFLATAATAAAQIPPPPATIYGSITDAAGEVEEGVVVEAFIDNTLCGTTETFFAGEGSERSTIYLIDVFSDGQEKGCGKDDRLIRLRVGGPSGRLAQQAIPWEAGLTRFDITFGDNVTPKPIPTATPTPPRTATGTATPSRTLAPGTRVPGSGSGTTEAATSTHTPADGVTGPTATGTRQDPASGGDGDDDGGGGFPLWGTVVLVIAGIAVIGGGIGLAMARAQRPGETGEPPSSAS